MVMTKNAILLLERLYGVVLSLPFTRAQQAASSFFAQQSRGSTFLPVTDELEPRLMLSADLALSGSDLTIGVTGADPQLDIDIRVNSSDLLEWSAGGAFSSDFDSTLADVQSLAADQLDTIVFEAGFRGNISFQGGDAADSFSISTNNIDINWGGGADSTFTVTGAESIEFVGGGDQDSLSYDANWQSVDYNATSGVIDEGARTVSHNSDVENVEFVDHYPSLFNDAFGTLSEILKQAASDGRFGDVPLLLTLDGQQVNTGNIIDFNALLADVAGSFGDEFDNAAGDFATRLEAVPAAFHSFSDADTNISATRGAISNAGPDYTVPVTVSYTKTVNLVLELGADAESWGIALAGRLEVPVTLSATIETDITFRESQRYADIALNDFAVDYQGDTGAIASPEASVGVLAGTVDISDLSMSAASGARTLGDVLANAYDINAAAENVSSTAGVGVSGDLVADFTFNSAAFTKMTGAVTDIEFSLAASQPLDLPGSRVTVEFADTDSAKTALHFGALVAEDIYGVFNSQADVLDALMNEGLFNEILPLVATGGVVESFADMYDLGGAWRTGVMDELLEEVTTGSGDTITQVGFASLQELLTDSSSISAARYSSANGNLELDLSFTLASVVPEALPLELLEVLGEYLTDADAVVSITPQGAVVLSATLVIELGENSVALIAGPSPLSNGAALAGVLTAQAKFELVLEDSLGHRGVFNISVPVDAANASVGLNITGLEDLSDFDLDSVSGAAGLNFALYDTDLRSFDVFVARQTPAIFGLGDGANGASGLLVGQAVTGYSSADDIGFYLDIGTERRFIELSADLLSDNAGYWGESLGFADAQTGASITAQTAISADGVLTDDAVLQISQGAAEAVVVSINAAESAGFSDRDELADLLQIRMTAAGLDISVGLDVDGKLELVSNTSDVLTLGISSDSKLAQLAADIEVAVNEAFSDVFAADSGHSLSEKEVYVDPGTSGELRVSVVDSAGVQTADTLTVKYSGQLAGNSSAAELLADLQQAISLSDAAGVIAASLAGGRIVFSPVNNAAAAALQLGASQDGLMEALGFDSSISQASRSAELLSDIQNAIDLELLGSDFEGAIKVILSGDSVLGPKANADGVGGLKLNFMAVEGHDDITLIRLHDASASAGVDELGLRDSQSTQDLDVVSRANSFGWSLDVLNTTLAVTASAGSDGVKIADASIGMLGVELLGSVSLDFGTVISLDTATSGSDFFEAIDNGALGELFTIVSDNGASGTEFDITIAVSPSVSLLALDDATITGQATWPLDSGNWTGGYDWSLNAGAGIAFTESFAELGWSHISEAIALLGDYLDAVSAATEQLNAPVLLVGQSINDSIKLSDAVTALLADLDAQPPATLQQLNYRLDQLLGSGTDADDWVQYDQADNNLKFKIPLSVESTENLPFALDFLDLLDRSGTDLGVEILSGLDGDSNLNISTTAVANLVLGVSLDSPSQATLPLQFGAQAEDLDDFAAFLSSSLDELLDRTPGYMAGDIVVTQGGGVIDFSAAEPQSITALAIDGAAASIAEPSRLIDIEILARGGSGTDAAQLITVNSDYISWLRLRIFGSTAESDVSEIISTDLSDVTAIFEALYGEGNVSATVTQSLSQLFIRLDFAGDLAGQQVGRMALDSWGVDLGELVATGATQPDYAAQLYGADPAAGQALVNWTVVVSGEGVSGEAMLYGSTDENGELIPAQRRLAIGPIVRPVGNTDPLFREVDNDVYGFFSVGASPDDGLWSLADQAVDNTSPDSSGIGSESYAIELAMSTISDGDSSTIDLVLGINLADGSWTFESPDLAGVLTAASDNDAESMLTDPAVMSDGLSTLWDSVVKALVTQIGGFEVPMLGAGFDAVFDFFERIGEDMLAGLGSALNRQDPALNPTRFLQSVFYNIFGPEADEAKAHDTIQAIVTDYNSIGGAYDYQLGLGMADATVAGVGAASGAEYIRQRVTITYATGGKFRLKIGDSYTILVPLNSTSSEPVADQLSAALERALGDNTVQSVTLSSIAAVDDFDTGIGTYDLPEGYVFDIIYKSPQPLATVVKDDLVNSYFQTLPISSRINAEQLEEALESLPNIGYRYDSASGTYIKRAGDTVKIQSTFIQENMGPVTGYRYNVQFTGELAGAAIPLLVSNAPGSGQANAKSPEELDRLTNIYYAQNGGKDLAAKPYYIGGVKFGGLNILKKLDSTAKGKLSYDDIKITGFSLADLAANAFGNATPDGWSVMINLGQLNVFADSEWAVSPSLDFSLGTEFGGLSLDNANLSVELGWNMLFSFGVHKEFGFYSWTNAQDRPELSLTLSVGFDHPEDDNAALDPPTIAGWLFPFSVTAVDKIDGLVDNDADTQKQRTKRTSLQGTFSIDIKDPDRNVLPVKIDSKVGSITTTGNITIEIPLTTKKGDTVYEKFVFPVSARTGTGSTLGVKIESLRKYVYDQINVVAMAQAANSTVASAMGDNKIQVEYDAFTNSFVLSFGTSTGVSVDTTTDGGGASESVDDMVDVQWVQQGALAGADGTGGQDAVMKISFSSTGISAASRQTPYVLSWTGPGGESFPSDLGLIDKKGRIDELAIRVALQGHTELKNSNIELSYNGLRDGRYEFLLKFKNDLGAQPLNLLQIARPASSSSVAKAVNEVQVIDLHYDTDITDVSDYEYYISFTSPDGTTYGGSGLQKITRFDELGIKQALLAHPGITAGSVRVRLLSGKSDDGPYDARYQVIFTGDLAGTNVNTLVIEQRGPGQSAPTAAANTVALDQDIKLDRDGDRLTMKELVMPQYSWRDFLEARIALEVFVNLALDISLPEIAGWTLPQLYGNFHYYQKLAEFTTGTDRNTGGRAPFPITQDGQLDTSKSFVLRLNSTDKYTVTVSKLSTATNNNVFDLVTDVQKSIDQALRGTKYAGKVKAEFDAENHKINFVSTSPSVKTVSFAMAGADRRVGFTNIELDVGSLFNGALGNFLGWIMDTVGSFDFLVGPEGMLYTRIPIISDLAGKTVTLLDMVKTFGDAEVDKFVSTVSKISGFVSQIDKISDSLKDQNSSTLVIPIGSFDLPASTPGESSSDIDDKKLKNAKTTDSSQGATASDKAGASQQSSKTASKSSSLTKSMSKSKAQFAIPILQDPMMAIKLLMGQWDDVVLATVDLPELSLEMNYRQKFPIFGPLVATLSGQVGASIDLALGFDLSGVNTFVNGGSAASVLNGFYISDTDHPTGKGADVPELSLYGSIGAGAGISAGVVSAGVEGGITMRANFDLDDPDRDGRVRFDEMWWNITNNDNNPFAIFDISLDLGYYFKAYVEVLFWEKEWTIASGTIWSTSVSFERQAQLATMQSDGQLLLNMGTNAASRLNGNISDNGERFEVSQDGGTIKVKYGSQEQSFSNVDSIVAYGGAGNDTLEIIGTVNVPLTFYGGDGDDMLKGGDGDDVFYGEAGSDTIYGYGGNDTLYGGPGIDYIYGGDGNDTIYGDADGDYLYGQDDNDTIYGGYGDDLLDGGDGNDHFIFESAFGSDEIFDSSGNDTIDFGEVYSPLKFTVAEILGSVDFEAVDSAQNSVVHSAMALENVIGSRGADRFYISASGSTDTVYNGSAGSDSYTVELDLLGSDVTIADRGNLWDSDKLFAQGDDLLGDMIVFSVDRIMHLRGGGAQTGVIFTPGLPEQGVDVDLEEITLNTFDGDDVVFVSATQPDARSSIYGGSGSDKILVGAKNIELDPAQVLNSTGDLTGITGEVDLETPLRLSGGEGDDTILLLADDASDDLAGRFSGSNGLVRFDGMGMEVPVLISTAETVTLRSGSGDDYVKVAADFGAITHSNPATPLALSIDGAAGDDVYQVDFAADGRSRVDISNSGIGSLDLLNLNGTEQDDNLLFREGKVYYLNAAGADNADYQLVRYSDITGKITAHGWGGDDYFALDDSRANLALFGDLGEDSFQIGQIYAAGHAPTEVDALETTLGDLSPGVHAASAMFGGEGDDFFVVYHNVAAIALYGEADDDTFIVRSFALKNPTGQDDQELSEIDSGEGVDTIMYATNAPVLINGGDGNDKVVIIGTELPDKYVLTRDQIYGGGLNVSFTQIENLILDSWLGDDVLFVLGSDPNINTQIIANTGDDTVTVGGDPGSLPSQNDIGHSVRIDNLVDTGATGDDYLDVVGPSLELNVIDDDAPMVEIIPSEDILYVSETDGESSRLAWFDVIPTKAIDPADADLHVHLTAAGPTHDDDDEKNRGIRFVSPADIVSENITLTFTADNWDVPQRVYVVAVQDSDLEGLAEIVVLPGTEQRSGNDTFEYHELPLSLVQVIVIDDESPGILLQPLGEEQLIEGDSRQFAVSLFAQPTDDITVAMDFGADLGADISSLNFDSANWHIPQIVTITALVDDIGEGPELATLSAFVSSFGTDDRYEDMATDLLILDVIDADTPSVVAESTDDAIISEDGRFQWSYTLRLATQPQGDVVVDILPMELTSAGADWTQVTVSASSVTFDSDNWNIPQEIFVTAIDDDIADDINLTFVPPVSDLYEIAGNLLIDGGGDSGYAYLVQALIPPDEPDVLPVGDALPEPEKPESECVNRLWLQNTASGAMESLEITESTINGLSMGAGESNDAIANISYWNIHELEVLLGFGGDEVTILDTLANSELRIYGGAGGAGGAGVAGGLDVDIRSLGAGSSSWIRSDMVLANTYEVLTNLSASRSFSVVDDSGDSLEISGLGDSAVLRVYTQGGSDYALITAINDNVDVELSFGDGDDLLDLRDDAIGSVIDVNGQGGDDYLVISDGLVTRGVFDGGEGVDTLDYSRWTSGVRAELNTGRATSFNDGFDGGLLNVENAIGGLGSDIFIGSDFDNYFNGNAGDDFITALGGNDLLADGPGSDSLDGGLGDDYYILQPGDDQRYASRLNAEWFDTDPADDGFGDLGVSSPQDIPVAANDIVTDLFGNDTLDFSQSAVAIVIDLARDSGQSQRIDPEYRDYTLMLTGEFEVLLGSDYDDLIRGAARAEQLTGGPGNDIIYGRSGNDLLNGGSGDDALFGGSGDDTFSVSPGSDSFSGNSGLDTVDYSDAPGAVLIDLTAETADNAYGGVDTFKSVKRAIGSSFDDTLRADTSGSELFGGPGNDILEGSKGRDLLTGGPGDDSIIAGKGSDTVSWSFGDGVDDLDAGAGKDVLNVLLGQQDDELLLDDSGDQLSAWSNGTRFVTATGLFEVQASLGGGDDALFDYTNDVRLDISGGDGDDIFFAGGGRDTFRGDAGTDGVDYGAAATGIVLSGSSVKDGMDGKDRLYDHELVFGSNFDDRISTGSGDQIVHGRSGDDIIKGGSGNDQLFGDEGNDKLYAGSGNDTLLGGPGDDTLKGSSGANYMMAESGEDTYLGGSKDTLDMSAATSGVTVDLAGRVLVDHFGPGNTVRGIGTVIGSDFDDTLIGTGGKQTLLGGLGNDFLSGGGSKDVLEGGPGNDIINGGSGRDSIVYTPGDGSDSSDETMKAASLDILVIRTGGASDNIALAAMGDGSIGVSFNASGLFSAAVAGYIEIDSGAGDDVVELSSTLPDTLKRIDIDLGDGDDSLLAGGAVRVRASGGPGDDTFYGSGLGVFRGDEGTDTVDYSAASGSVSATGSGGRHESGQSDSFKSIEILRGSQYGDKLKASGTLTHVFGGDGDDKLYGSGASSMLFGEAGDDYLRGGGSDARLFGGEGADTLDGRNSHKTAVDYSSSASPVNITFADKHSGEAVVGGGVGADVDVLVNVRSVIGSSSSDSISAELAKSMVINGGGGDDNITGSRYGDTFVWNSGDGADSVDAGDGKDTMKFGNTGDNATIWDFEIDDGLASLREDLSFDQGSFANVENFDILAGGGDDNVRITSPVGSDLGNSRITVKADGGGGDDYIDASLAGLGVSITGGTGKDHLLGGAFKDTLLGGDGDDTLYGQGGKDLMKGDAGSDRYMLGEGSGSDRIYDSQGDNALDFSLSTTPVYLRMPGFEEAQGLDENGNAVEDDTPDNALSDSQHRYTLDGKILVNARLVTIIGSDYDDVIFGNTLSNVIIGGLGDDSIRGGAGDDLLIGDQAQWLIDSVVTGGVGAGGDDEILGDSGSDVIIGGAGDDVLSGGSGDDLLAGGWVAALGSGLWIADADGVSGWGSWSQWDILEVAGDGSDTLVSGSGSDILIGGSDGDNLSGDSGSNQLFGGFADLGDASATLSQARTDAAFDGDDELYTRTGDDSLFGGSGSDSLIADRAFGGLLDGGIGSDSLSGRANRLVGWYGNDVLSGMYASSDSDIRFWSGFGEDQLGASGGDGVMDLGANDRSQAFGNDLVSVTEGQYWIYSGNGQVVLSNGFGASISDGSGAIILIE